jgi:hypothetical protein
MRSFEPLKRAFDLCCLATSRSRSGSDGEHVEPECAGGQTSAVARCSASSVPSGIGIGSLARLRTGGRSCTRSMPSSRLLTVRYLVTAEMMRAAREFAKDGLHAHRKAVGDAGTDQNRARTTAIAAERGVMTCG